MHTLIAFIGFLVLTILISAFAGVVLSVPAVILAILVGADLHEWAQVVFVGACVVCFPLSFIFRMSRLVNWVLTKRQEDRIRKNYGGAVTTRLLKRPRLGPWRLSRLRLPRDTVAELARDARAEVAALTESEREILFARMREHRLNGDPPPPDLVDRIVAAEVKNFPW